MIPLFLIEWLRTAAKACAALYRRPIVGAGVVLGVVMFCGGMWIAHRRSAKLSASLAARVEAHVVETRAETTVVNAAVRAARSDSVEAAHALTAAAPHERRAVREGKQADSLARTADWRDAYDARTREVGELFTLDSLKDRATVAMSRADEELTAAVHVSELRADRSDSLVHDLAQAVGESNHCRLRCWAWRVAVVGALGAAGLVGRALARR